MKKHHPVRNLAAVFFAASFFALSPNFLHAADGTVKVSCIGDSITAGYGLPKGTKTYPMLLEELLGKGFEVGNFGASARTLQKAAVPPSYWQCQEWQAARDFQPSVVVIILGTNDSKPKNFDNIKNLSADAKDMIQILRKLPSHPVILVGLPPPIYKTNFGINEENMARIRKQLKEVADDEKVATLDLDKALSGHPEWFPDGIHPNAAGVEALAKAVSGPVLEAAKTAEVPK